MIEFEAGWHLKVLSLLSLLYQFQAYASRKSALHLSY